MSVISFIREFIPHSTKWYWRIHSKQHLMLSKNYYKQYLILLEKYYIWGVSKLKNLENDLLRRPMSCYKKCWWQTRNCKHKITLPICFMNITRSMLHWIINQWQNWDQLYNLQNCQNYLNSNGTLRNFYS